MKNLFVILGCLAILAFGNVALAHHGHHYYGGVGVYVAPPVYVAPQPYYVAPPVYVDPYYVAPPVYPQVAPPVYVRPVPVYPRPGVIVGGRSWGVRVGW